jgi:hypothetical protein
VLLLASSAVSVVSYAAVRPDVLTAVVLSPESLHAMARVSASTAFHIAVEVSSASLLVLASLLLLAP